MEGEASEIANVVYFDNEVGLNIVATKEVGVGVGVLEVDQVVIMTGGLWWVLVVMGL